MGKGGSSIGGSSGVKVLGMPFALRMSKKSSLVDCLMRWSFCRHADEHVFRDGWVPISLEQEGTAQRFMGKECNVTAVTVRYGVGPEPSPTVLGETFQPFESGPRRFGFLAVGKLECKGAMLLTKRIIAASVMWFANYRG